MNEREFCYWLQGMFELTNAEELTKEQVCMVKEHLKLVFTKVTPPLTQTDYEEIIKRDLQIPPSLLKNDVIC